MSDLDKKLEQGRGYINEALEKYQPSHCFALFSGGHDSLSATHFAAMTLGDRLSGVVHVNTGIGIKETRQFVRDVCEQYGWPLLEYKATENTKADGTPDPQIYEDMVVKSGFPGPFAHRFMYIRLKERQINRLCREHKPGPIALISGIRQQESTRRMGHTESVYKDGGRIWVSPFFDLDAVEVNKYLKENSLPRNPVKDYLHMSGECLCGAFAHKGELAEIKLWYPDAAAEIERIQDRVVSEGGFPWGWEEQPPDWWLKRNEGQSDAFQNEFDEAVESRKQMLCVGCNKRAEYEAA